MVKKALIHGNTCGAGVGVLLRRLKNQRGLFKEKEQAGRENWEIERYVRIG